VWIEHFGVLNIKTLDGSISCTLNFKKSGLFQGTQYKVEGYIEDRQGKKLVKLEGRWDEYMEAKWLEDTLGNKKGTVKKLWFFENPVRDSINFSAYTRSLNDFDRSMEEILLPSDARRRLDRRFLEFGDANTATGWKKIMEDRQRVDRKAKKGWHPLWFKRDESFEGPDGKGLFVYCGDYWEQRAKKIEAYQKGQDYLQYLRPPQLNGLACDFSSYQSDTLSSKVPVETDDTITDTPTTDTFTNEDQKDGTDTDGDGSDFDNEDNQKADKVSATVDKTLTVEKIVI